MSTGDDTETTASVFARHLNLEIEAAQIAKSELLKSMIFTTPLGRLTRNDRKSVERFSLAVEHLRQAYDNLPKSLQAMVRIRFRTIFQRPHGFLGQAAFEKEPIEKCFLSLESSSSLIDSDEVRENADKSNWQAIAVVDYCRSLWRVHKSKEPPLQIAKLDTFERRNPFAAFVADVLKAEGIDCEAHTAVRAWRRTVHRNGNK